MTYGNGYQNGYLGRDLSGSGWGLKFDFIIIHEAGHEWFANNITYKGIADMWIHESFTAYSESLYVEYHHGKEAGAAYVTGTRTNINNDKPIIGTYGVNARGSGDMYYKGSNMLHTLRQVVNDDNKWRDALRGLNATYYHKTVTTQDIESYLSSFFDIDLQSFFDQYLRSTQIPILEYGFRNGRLGYRWINVVEGFNMPIDVEINGASKRLEPSRFWKNIELDKKPEHIIIDSDFYAGSIDLFGL